MNRFRRLKTRQSQKANLAMTSQFRRISVAAGLCALAVLLNADHPVVSGKEAPVDRINGVEKVTIASQQDVRGAAESPARAMQWPLATSADSYDWSTQISPKTAHAAVSNNFVGPRPKSLVDDEADSPRKAARLPRDKMSGPVAALAAAGGRQEVDIVVRYTEYPELFDDDYVRELGGEVTRVYQTLDMRAVRISAAALEELAAAEKVDWLSVDDTVSFTSVASREAANLPGAGSAHAGWSGTNVGVAVVDTGVASHADLDANIVQYSFLNGAYPTPAITNGAITALNDDPREDLFGHGTHVAGILTGSGAESGDAYQGAATSSVILSLQVLDASGAGSMSDVMAALDWLLQYGSYFDIQVVNLSLGKNISESNTTDPLVLAVEALWDAGMVVVVAAGNDGNAGSMTITSPGNSRKVITVGSGEFGENTKRLRDALVAIQTGQAPDNYGWLTSV